MPGIQKHARSTATHSCTNSCCCTAHGRCKAWPCARGGKRRRRRRPDSPRSLRVFCRLCSSARSAARGGCASLTCGQAWRAGHVGREAAAATVAAGRQRAGGALESAARAIQAVACVFSASQARKPRQTERPGRTALGMTKARGSCSPGGGCRPPATWWLVRGRLGPRGPAGRAGADSVKVIEAPARLRH